MNSSASTARLRIERHLYPLLVLLGLASGTPAIAATFDLQRPMGGEVYIAGNTMTIEWELALSHGEYVDTIDFYYAWGGESTYHYIGSTADDLFDGTYRWRVPAVTGMDYLRIRAYATGIDVGTVASATSLHVKIVQNSSTPSVYLAHPQPSCAATDAGCPDRMVVEPGMIVLIRWNLTGCVHPYDSVPMTIRFSSDGGRTYSAVPGGEVNPCVLPFFRWTVPNVETRNAKIRLDWGSLDWSSNVHSFEIAAAPPPPNHAPVADAGRDIDVSEGSPVTLDGTASHDPDAGDRITYQWERTDSWFEYDFTLHGATTATPSFTAPDLTTFDKTFIFTLTVRDQDGARDTDVVEVTVSPGGPVISSIDPLEGWDKTPITIRGSDLSGCAVRMHGVRVATVPATGSDSEFRFPLPEGLPLGSTRIRVTNDTGSSSSAQRFEVLRVPYSWDWGFGFHNPSVAHLGWADYANCFGDAVFMTILGIPVCCDGCDRQCHDPLAQLLYDYYVRDLGAPGVCWGMCKQSLNLYYGDESEPYAEPIRDYPFDLDPETEITRRIKRDHITQVSAEVIEYLIDHYDDSPLEVLARIEAETSGESPQPGIISIASLTPGGGVTEISGHAIVPDRVEQVGPEEWRIYVYDPNREYFAQCRDNNVPAEQDDITTLENYPFVRVWVDGHGVERWSFDMGGSTWGGSDLLGIDVSVSGSTFLEIDYSGFMYYPRSVVRGRHHLPVSAEGLFIILTGAADAGVENASGRMLGYDEKGALHLEIDGALPIVPQGGPGFSEAEAYSLPDGKYTTRVHGVRGGEYSWVAARGDSIYAIEGAAADARTEDVVGLDPRGGVLTLRSTESQKPFSAKIAEPHEDKEGAVRRVFEILDTRISDGVALFRVTTDQRSLVYENRGKDPVKFRARLSLAGLGPQPEPPDLPVALLGGRGGAAGMLIEDVSVEVGPITLPPDHTLVLTPDDWSRLGASDVEVRIVPPGGVGTAFLRGDVNADSSVDISDGIAILGYLFLGSPARLACEKSADPDDNGTIQLTDAVYLLNYLFLGGAQPAVPFPDCGLDPTEDGLSCSSSPACE